MCLWGPACNGYTLSTLLHTLSSYDIHLVEIIPNIATDRTKPTVACGYRQ